MEKISAAPTTTPPVAKGGRTKPTFKESAEQRSQFFTMALDMSWQLAVVVLLPVVGGHYLDEHLKTSPLWTLAGLGLAFVMSGVVMWQALQAANRLPVPKLTAAQRRAIKKSYEEEDND